jgi:hypothetical protein
MKRNKLSIILGLLIITALVLLIGYSNSNITIQKEDMPNMSSMQLKSNLVDTVEVTAQRPEMMIEEINVNAPHPNKIQNKKELSHIKLMQPNPKSLQ